MIVECDSVHFHRTERQDIRLLISDFVADALHPLNDAVLEGSVDPFFDLFD